ncbi:MAG TPA: APC family permease [Rhizomicrobium sp.]|jgi:amino acid transporter|nr:APC family permease [Rhizomicrobium sp.]
MADVAASQRLRFFDTAFYAIAAGIGMRWVAVAAAVGPASLPLWTLALFTFYFPLAAATAELTTRFEGEGGIYVWTRDALGPLSGFLCGWFYWISLMPFFAGILIFGSGLIIAALGGDPKNAFLSISISLVISLLVMGVQLAGLKYGKWLPNIGTAGAWIVFAMIILLALVLGSEGRSATDFLHSSYLAPANFDTAILWGTMVFAYSGVESLGFLRNEIDGGMRTILRVLVIVGIGSLVIYVGGTSAFLIVLPKSALTRLSGLPDALRLGFAHVGFAYLGTIAIALFALTMLGAFTAWFGVGARLPFAAGIDNFLPAVFARRHPRTGAPVAAILLQGALMLTIMVVSQAGTSVAGAYDLLVSMSILSVSIPYVFLFAAYAKCALMPAVPGAWTPPGAWRTSYLLAWTGLVSTIIAIGCTLVPNPGDAHPLLGLAKIAISTLLMMGAGLFFYWLAHGRRGQRSAQARA